MRVSRGAPKDTPGQCSADLGCSVLNVAVQNMDPGTYTVECWYHDSKRRPGETHRWSNTNSIRVGSNGSFSGSGGCSIESNYVKRLWVVINGVKSNEIQNPW